MDRIDYSPLRKVAAIGTTGAVILAVLLLAALHSLTNKTLQIEQLNRRIAELKVEVFTHDMNAKEIEAERHEMELAWKGSQQTLKLAKQVIREYGMSKDKELDEALHGETVKPRATGAILPDIGRARDEH